MRVALVHDWLTGLRGGERVLHELAVLYPDADLYTLHPERFLAAETIREKILLTTRNELPFTTAVVIEKWEEAEERNFTKIYACILVEKPGQKAILIGRKGENIKRLGIAARRDLQELLGRRVHLELFVRHEPGWREDSRRLAEIL